MLIAYGADIETHGPDSIVVHGQGVEALRKDVTHTLIPDLIEVVPWICAGTVLDTGPLRITGPGMDGTCAALAPDLTVLHETGARSENLGQEILGAPRPGPPARS